jgi:hypothetical protein
LLCERDASAAHNDFDLVADQRDFEDDSTTKSNDRGATSRLFLAASAKFGFGKGCLKAGIPHVFQDHARLMVATRSDRALESARLERASLAVNNSPHRIEDSLHFR